MTDLSEKKVVGRCPICGNDVYEEDAVRCSVCGAVMHRGCVDEEALTDADGNPLCPYCAAIAAIDWFDAVITSYSHALSDEQREEIIARLENYLKLLRGERSSQ